MPASCVEPRQPPSRPPAQMRGRRRRPSTERPGKVTHRDPGMTSFFVSSFPGLVLPSAPPDVRPQSLVFVPARSVHPSLRAPRGETHVRRRMMQDAMRRWRHLGLGLAAAKERLAFTVLDVTRRNLPENARRRRNSDALVKQPAASDRGARSRSRRTRFDLATSHRESRRGDAPVPPRPRDSRAEGRSDQPSPAAGRSPASSSV